ncbi:MAG: PucR family transcriptional regulator [Sulfobacillus acidophilus]|uniref:PucR family transcriptional regulator n=1 Tax=Sulfobacillus acidophilus TaxID=53633 RepID=A0A2T2WDJ8_9FIRM|nr:MAG: PucR family transcriptional regulator [Sulfobacillus acidophilus]
MITVADCLRLTELTNVTVVAGSQGLLRTVRLTHASDEPDVLSWVAPEIIVLTTGQNYSDDPDVWVHLIAQLDEADVSALMVSPGRYLAELPMQALEEANRRNFPVLMVPWEVPFVRITAAIHRLLLENHIAEWSRVAQLGVRVTEAVVQAKTLDALLQAFSELIGYPVRVDLEPATGAPHGTAFALPSPDLSGWSLVVEAVDLMEPEVIVARQMAGTFAIWILQQKLSVQSEFEAQAALFDQLLSGQGHDSARVRDRLRMLGVHSQRKYALLLLTLPDPLDKEAQSRVFDDVRMVVTQLLHSALLLSTSHPMGLLCLLAEDRIDRRALTGGFLDPFFSRFPGSVGVLSTPAGLADLPVLTRSMSQMIPLLVRGRVHDMAQVLFASVIVNLPEELMQGLVGITWQRLTDKELIPTLRALIENGGHRKQAALRLGIHRNTMTRRVQAIEQQLGRPLTPALLTQLDLCDQWMRAREPNGINGWD